MYFKNSIIYEDKTKVIPCLMSFFICDKDMFLLVFTSQIRLIFKITSPINSSNGSFLKPFKTLAAGVLSGLQH